jgi:hypothetical protein
MIVIEPGASFEIRHHEIGRQPSRASRWRNPADPAVTAPG